MVTLVTKELYTEVLAMYNLVNGRVTYLWLNVDYKAQILVIFLNSSLYTIFHNYI